CLVALYYTQFTSVLLFGALGLFTLVVYRRRVWLWIPCVATGTVLCIPQLTRLPALMSTVSIQNPAASQPKILLSLPDLLANLFQQYSGTGALTIAWLALLGVASIAILYWSLARRSMGFIALALLLWMAIPAFLRLYPSGAYRIIDYASGTYKPPYFWAIVPGFALWSGWGLSLLRPRLRFAAGVVLVVAMCWWLPPLYTLVIQPFNTNFAILAENLQPDDVVLVDHSFGDPETFVWDYFTKVYFPNGLRFVSDPTPYRRVWYISKDGFQDQATYKQLTKDHVPGVFFGPWDFLVRLYEAPPDSTGILFDNGMRFHGAEVVAPITARAPTTVRDGESITLRLWWSVDSPPKADYSRGIYVMAPDKTIQFQDDGPPQVANAPTATSQWIPGRYYIEERTLKMPDAGREMLFNVDMAVYEWWDNKRIAAPGLNADSALTIQQVKIKSWTLP
ncbi:MAG TPA: hypothetical protein VKQ72_03405, partial [Aggregatilineales bacterium]|nr:hypothetical protein [Aggregatilineales bacterium]